jgi:excisionase family DNA binding protein
MKQQGREPPVLVTVEEAARILSIGRTACYMLVLKGKLQSVKIGRSRRVVLSSLQEFITQQLESE